MKAGFSSSNGKEDLVTIHHGEEEWNHQYVVNIAGYQKTLCRGGVLNSTIVKVQVHEEVNT